MMDGEYIEYEDFRPGEWSVEIHAPGGPIAREWFDESGNWHTLYENGAESVISAEVLADDALAEEE